MGISDCNIPFDLKQVSEWLQLTFLTLKYWKFIQFDHFFLFFNIINV